MPEENQENLLARSPEKRIEIWTHKYETRVVTAVT
jgi:hypothetical protein